MLRSYRFFQTISYTAGLVVVVLCLYKSGDYNEEVYTVETDYIKWVTRLPAFTVCPSLTGRHVLRQISRFAGKSSISPSNVTFFLNLAQPKKFVCFGCPVNWLEGLSTNLTAVVDLITPPCESQLLDCFWNGIAFPCCQHFQPLKTRKGICYTLNSEQTSGSGFPIEQPIKLVTSYLNPRADLTITAQTAFRVHVHDRKAMAFAKPKFNIPKGHMGFIQYKFTETIAKDSAKQLRPTQRKCILNGEMPLPGYKVYHYSSCRDNCLAEKQIAMCGCRHHLLSGHGPICSINGLQCLDISREKFNKRKCECKLSCTGQDIQYVHASLRRANDSSTASVRTSLMKAPTERDVYYAKTTILESLVGFVCLTRLITTADLYDAALALLVLVRNYMAALNFLRKKTTQLLKIKQY